MVRQGGCPGHWQHVSSSADPGPCPGNRHDGWGAYAGVSHGLHGNDLLQEQLEEEAAEPDGIRCGGCPQRALHVHSTGQSWTTTTECTPRLASICCTGARQTAAATRGALRTTPDSGGSLFYALSYP